jgi:hypothetical protein
MQTRRAHTDLLFSPTAGWLVRFEQCDVKYLALDPDQDRTLIRLLQSRPEWTLEAWESPVRGQPAPVLFVRSDVLQ